jgi:hypothetical protein
MDVFFLERQKSRMGQRELAATATTRDFDVDSFHLRRNSVFST